MPQVTILYFATLREQRGCSREELEVPAGATLGSLYAELFPPGPEGALPVAFARNQQYAGPDDPVVDGDEIAFLPPLGGG